MSVTEANKELVGKYVIVRCNNAGVHAGYLKSWEGRNCVLTQSRRLWYWVPADKAKWLSGVAAFGLDYKESNIGEETATIILTENCEINECTPMAEKSIREIPADKRK